jgi:pyruvate/2-oxoglutarate dehydrogenase complex dihydrolipoamide acyltransferase (E2) component
MGTSDVGDEPIAVRIAHSGLAEEVVLLEWLVADGAVVGAGAPLVRIESEKTELEIAAPAAGRVEIVVPASDIEVPVGITIGWIRP